MGRVEYLKREYSDEEIYKILEKPVREWFRRKYKTFTPPQRYAIKEIHEGKNVLICSPTGSGKTLSAFLAGINELIKLSMEKRLEDRIYILYVSPLRALNNDIERNLKEPLKEIYEVAKELNIELDEIRVAVRTSDTTSSQKQKMLKKPPHILITTPESLAIALNSPKFSQLLSGIKYVIVDEIHALTNKRGVHLSLSLERLNRIANFIRIGLSATIYPLTEVAKFLVGNDRDCYIVDVNYAKEIEIKVISPVDDFIYTPSEEISKKLYNLLKKLIEEHKTTLIFTNTRSATERVAFNLKQIGVEKVETHHSSLSREHRLEVEEKLKKGELKVVVCVSPDTKILTNNGLIEIKDLKSNDKILGIDNFKGKFAEFDKPHIRDYNNDGFLIKTNLGFEIKCTKEHRFLTIANGELKWVESRTLKVGDHIAVLRKYPNDGEEINILDLLPDNAYVGLKKSTLEKIRMKIKEKYGTSKNFSKIIGMEESHFNAKLRGESPFKLKVLREIEKILSIKIESEDIEIIRTNKKIYPMKIKTFTPFLARLLGFWMADGSWTSGCLRLFSSDLQLLKEYEKRIIEELNIKPHYRRANKSTYCLEIPSSVLETMFKDLVGNKKRKSKNGMFPEILYKLPLEHKKAFLSGYFDGDGFLEIKKDNKLYSIGFSTFNKRFAEGIRDLLLYFGIMSSVRKQEINYENELNGRIIKKRGVSYTVSILGGEYLEKAINILDIWRTKDRELIKKAFSEGYCNIDIIPNIGKKLREIREKLRISTYKLQKEKFYNPQRVEVGERQISRRNLIKLMNKYLDYAKKTNNKEVIEEIESLLRLAEGDIFFDRIKEIKSIKLKKVYGIINSKTENYVVNNFISKNSSTSLELGVDIGSIDLVILLGSPKSVSRALQRIGRSGHRLHEKSRGIIIPFDRDDLVENVVLAYNAKIRRIDKVHIPKNCLDVLAQHLVGMAMEKVWDVDEAYNLIKKAYPYKDLSKEDFLDVLNYLSGGIEEKNVYAKIWLKDNKFGKRGKSVRAIYYMNVGTIPDETAVDVIADGKYVGEVEEEFAEKLMKGDIFVLGGRTYKYLGGRGNKIRVKEVFDEKPTIPAWFSEQLPLAYDLALDIERFRKEVLSSDVEEIMKKYDIDEKTAKAIKGYIEEQNSFAIVPDDENALIESFEEEKRRYYIFHFVAGRRANEALARAFANYISKIKNCNVRISVNDYGFALILPKNRKIKRADIVELFNLDIVKNVKESIERSEILRRRFRHVAARGFMILRRYMNKRISVERQQFNAEMLLKYCKDVNHPLYRETIREILEDSLDIDNALDYFKKIKKRKIYYLELPTPSPFAFNLVVSASSDVIFMEDKKKMIAELHKKVMEFISKKKGKKNY